MGHVAKGRRYARGRRGPSASMLKVGSTRNKTQSGTERRITSSGAVHVFHVKGTTAWYVAIVYSSGIKSRHRMPLPASRLCRAGTHLYDKHKVRRRHNGRQTAAMDAAVSQLMPRAAKSWRTANMFYLDYCGSGGYGILQWSIKQNTF